MWFRYSAAANKINIGKRIHEGCEHMANTPISKLPIQQRAAKFLKETMVELRKTSWPSKDELKKSTLLVLGAVGIVAIWIGGLDAIFGLITRRVVGW